MGAPFCVFGTSRQLPAQFRPLKRTRIRFWAKLAIQLKEVADPLIPV